MSKRILVGVIVAILVVFGIIFAVTNEHAKAPKPTSSGGSLRSLSTGPAPWQPEYQHLSDRLQAMNMPLLGAEGTAQHIHTHLDIFINGKAVQVPADIGVPPTGGITPVHTHDTTGIIHIESPDATATYTLGQFLEIWGVKLTDTSIGGYTDNATQKLVVYDNGKQVSDPVHLALKAHHEIVITYGTAGQAPNPIPKSYNFPAGL